MSSLSRPPDNNDINIDNNTNIDYNTNNDIDNSMADCYARRSTQQLSSRQKIPTRNFDPDPLINNWSSLVSSDWYN